MARRALALLLLPSLALAQVKTFTSDADFDSGVLVNTAHPPANQLQLGATPVTRTAVVWMDNYYPSWVLKIDANTGKQLGRYDAALTSLNGQATGARPPREYCNWSNLGNCPGRITTDNNGDVWIVNRAFGSQGTLSKFSGFPEHCIDRNHNGKIDTSFDANGDGIIDVTSAQEYLGQADECILTTIPIGPFNVWPRGVAVDRNGKIWVSTFVDGKVYRYNPAEPVTLEATVNVGGNPYSLATGGDSLFVSNAGAGGTRRVNINSLAVDAVACPTTYGVVGDPGGTVAWLGAWGANGIYKADFGNHTCTAFAGPANTGATAVTLDLQGNVWAGDYPAALVSKYSPAGVLLGNFPTGGANVHGMSVDFKGFIWTVNDANATVSKLDPNGNLVGTYSLGGKTNDDHTPYIYSDFTGVQVNRQAPYVYVGTWTGTYDGGVAQIPWASVIYNQEQQGAVPNGTTLKVFVRAADDMNTLATVGYTPVANGALLNKIVGRYAQVEADFNGPGYLTPVLSDLTINGPCKTTGDACCLADVDCDDKNACTLDRCPAPGSACVHQAKMACCNVDGDCGDGNLCTDDKCSGPGGTCGHAPKPGCCNVDADCGDGNLCTGDQCSGPGGTCTNPPIPGCCNGNGECDDGNACTIDLCSGAGGTCSHFGKAGCCNVDGDCSDGNACHDGKCSGPGGTCTFAAKPGCCNVDGDCDDGQPCTDDKCSGPGGTCSHPAKPNCCVSASDCDDKDLCTTDSCVNGTCVHDPILRCCNENGACDDGDPCTKDSCSGPGGGCVHDHVANCCSVAGECDDGDPCTVDQCANGQCAHAAKGAGCCTSDGDCDDGVACTTDRCSGGAACVHEPLANCACAKDADCPQDWMCVDRGCQPPAKVGDGGTGAYASGVGAFGGCSVSQRRTAPLPLLLLVIPALAARARGRATRR